MGLNKNKKGKKPKQKPFRPLGNPYKTQGQFNAAVNKEAGLGYQPELADIRAQGSAEERKHTTRGNELESLYNSYGNELQAAFDRTSGALNNLVAQSQGSSAADQAALRAALGASQGQQDQLAQRLGATGASVPSSAGAAATLAPAWGTAEAGKTGLGTSVAAMVAEAAQRRALPALGKIRSSEDESRRHFGERQRLQQARKGVLAKVPGLRQQARKGLMAEAREGVNLAFQQNLAGDQFGLEKQKFGLQKRQQSHQELMDKSNLELQLQQLNAQIDQAGTTEEADAAEAQAKALQNGYAYVDSLIGQPPKRPSGSGKGQQKRYAKDKAAYEKSISQGYVMPVKAYNDLRKRFGLSDHDATVIVNSVNLPNFKAWVQRHRRGPVKPNKGPGNPKPKTKTPG